MRGSFSRALIAARAFGDSLSRKIRHCMCVCAPGAGFCTLAWAFYHFRGTPDVINGRCRALDALQPRAAARRLLNAHWLSA
jgi:hypothetical protein